jgi:very-short-patch-repair endonuclease
VHRTTHLLPDEVVRKGAVPMTTPARTIFDLASELTLKDLQRTFESALVSRLIRANQLRSLLDRSPRRPGSAAVRALLDQHGRPAFTRSEAEQRLVSLMRAAELPPTDVNTRIDRFEVDALWRPQRLVVEVDGYAYHSNRAAFERDRRRDASLQAAGYRVMRVSWRQIQEQPEALVARLAQALVR